jgi:tetratricopeptide (TPR) repeat protein
MEVGDAMRDSSSDQPQHVNSDTESDHEVHDKAGDLKVVKKEHLLRVTKKILKPGTGIKQPGNDDIVHVKHIALQDSTQSDELKQLEDAKEELVELGDEKNVNQNWFDCTLTNMKKGEIALVTVKTFKAGEGDEKKVVDTVHHHQIELTAWEPVRDLDFDKTLLLRVLEKGITKHRIANFDEVSFSLKVKQGEQVLFEREKTAALTVPKDTIDVLELKPGDHLSDELIFGSKIIGKSLKAMHEGGKASVRVQLQKYNTWENVFNKVCPAPKEDLPITFEIQILSFADVDDIFEDGMILKKLLVEGPDYGMPGNTSCVAISLKIMAEDKVLYDTGAVPSIPKEEAQEFAAIREKYKTLCFYHLDEYKVSKMLKLTLKQMRRAETALVTVKSRSKLTYGFDYEYVKDIKPDIHLTYLITLHAFTDDKTGYSMAADEKIWHANRKREIGVKLIQEGQYKKALKVFSNINTYFDIGTHSEEDKARFRQAKLSSLLNSSLCQLKLEKWVELRATVDNILKIDPDNAKALFRKATLLFKLEEYEESKELIKKSLHHAQDPEIKAQFQALLAQVQAGYEVYAGKQKKLYSKMFN